MSKVIFEFDEMPKCCYDCPGFNVMGYRCCLSNRVIKYYEPNIFRSRQEWCPIVELSEESEG